MTEPYEILPRAKKPLEARTSESASGIGKAIKMHPEPTKKPTEKDLPHK